MSDVTELLLVFLECGLKKNKQRLIQGIMRCSFPTSKLTIHAAVTAAACHMMQTGRVTQHWQGSLPAVYS